MLTTPTVALTMGDPAGIGPEVVVQALADPQLASLARWIVVGDARVLAMAEQITGLSIQGRAEIHDVPTLGPMEGFTFGQLKAENGAAAVEYVRTAAELCLAQQADAMVTAPLNKEAVTLTGRTFSGHTEYIAELCGVSGSRMLLCSERLSTIHVTTHIPLRRACDIQTPRVLETIQLGHDAMQLLGFPRPRIAVCGLNPHAGEHGLFGEEDARVIAPAIEEARRRGIDCTGPHAGDT